jgi:hypothetical protein
MNLEREALSGLLRQSRLWWWSLAGHAGLAALIYGWLWIPDQRIWQVILSGMGALAVVAALVWLENSLLSRLVGTPLGWRRMLAWLAVAALFVALVTHLAGYAERLSVWLASLITMTVRKPISPHNIAWFISMLWTLLLVGGAVLLVPFATRAFADAWRVCRKSAWWLEAVVVLVAGFYLPWKLVHWSLQVGGLVTQTISLLVRFALAGAMVVTAWLLLHLLASMHARPES